MRTLLVNSLSSKKTTLAILGVSVLIRVLVLFWFTEIPLYSDARSYHNMALQLLQGESFAPYWPPGLPYFLSFFYAVFGVNEVIGRASMIFFYVLLIVGLFLILKDTVSLKIANLIILLFGFYPTFIYHSIDTLTPMPLAAYLIWIVLLTYRATHRQAAIELVVLGGILGLSVLTRPSSLSLLGLIPAYILIKRRSLLSALLPIVVAILIIAPWLVRVHQMTGNFVMINYANSYNFFMGNNEFTPLYETWVFGSDASSRPAEYNEINESIKSNPPHIRDQLYRQNAINAILERPDLFIVRTINRFRTYWGFDTYVGSALIAQDVLGNLSGMLIIAIDFVFYSTLMFSALFAWPLWRNTNHQVPVVLVLGVILFYAVPYFIAFSHPTYHFPVIPLAACFSAISLQYMWDNLHTLKQHDIWNARRKPLFWMLIGIFIVIQIEWGLIMGSRFLS